MARMEEDVVFSNLRDKLFTAVVGDVLDRMGRRRQFLPQAIGPLRPDMKLVGRAMPVLEADIFDDSGGSPGSVGSKPFGLMLEALDDLRANEVYVATGGSLPNEVYVATGGSLRYAFWGELMSTRARYLNAAAPSSTASCATLRGSRRLAFRPSAADCMRRTRARAAR